MTSRILCQRRLRGPPFPAERDCLLLYVDVLGFGLLVRQDSLLIPRVYHEFRRCSQDCGPGFESLAFSDTLLVQVSLGDRDALFAALCVRQLVDAARRLFLALAQLGVFFRAVVTKGPFRQYRLSELPCFYGAALIEAYETEKALSGVGLYVRRELLAYMHESSEEEPGVMDKVRWTEARDGMVFVSPFVHMTRENVLNREVGSEEVKSFTDDGADGPQAEAKSLSLLWRMSQIHRSKRVRSKHRSTCIAIARTLQVGKDDIRHYAEAVAAVSRGSARYHWRHSPVSQEEMSSLGKTCICAEIVARSKHNAHLQGAWDILGSWIQRHELTGWLDVFVGSESRAGFDVFTIWLQAWFASVGRITDEMDPLVLKQLLLKGLREAALPTRQVRVLLTEAMSEVRELHFGGRYRLESGRFTTILKYATTELGREICTATSERIYGGSVSGLSDHFGNGAVYVKAARGSVEPCSDRSRRHSGQPRRSKPLQTA